MYYCINCSEEFEEPKKIIENHGFSSPPYEEVLVCPFCFSPDFFETRAVYCKCCGAKLKGRNKVYCSDKCRERGLKLWKKELKRKQINLTNPLNSIVRELEEYNKKNNTLLSYGQYIAYIKTKKG